MATFRSTGHTVFRDGDPAIPDIAAEKRGKAPSVTTRSGRDSVSSTAKTRSSASRRLRKGSETARRALRAFARRGDRSEGRPYELDGALADGLREEAKRRGASEREVLEEAVRLYLAGRERCMAGASSASTPSEGRGWGGVEIGHPLSDGFRIILGGGPPAIPLVAESVRRWLTEGSVAWHVEVLATAPEPNNPETVRWLRTFAETFAWTNLEVRAILGVLADAGALEEGEEYDWMRRTVGGGAPDLPRPNPAPHVIDEYRYRIGR